jgi:hypothetical protein
MEERERFWIDCANSFCGGFCVFSMFPPTPTYFILCAKLIGESRYERSIYFKGEINHKPHPSISNSLILLFIVMQLKYKGVAYSLPGHKVIQMGDLIGINNFTKCDKYELALFSNFSG